PSASRPPAPVPGRGPSAPRQAAIRECAEELGVELDAGRLHLVGEFSAPAANEPGHDVRATVFEHPWVEVGAPLAEIEHVEWVHPADATAELAPLLRDVVLPALGVAGKDVVDVGAAVAVMGDSSAAQTALEVGGPQARPLISC